MGKPHGFYESNSANPAHLIAAFVPVRPGETVEQVATRIEENRAIRHRERERHAEECRLNKIEFDERKHWAARGVLTTNGNGDVFLF